MVAPGAHHVYGGLTTVIVVTTSNRFTIDWNDIAINFFCYSLCPLIKTLLKHFWAKPSYNTRDGIIGWDPLLIRQKFP